MCGIYVISDLLSEIEIDQRLEPIQRRGPDYRGFFACKDFTLGHTRLAILDLDERSNQPFEYQGFRIVFNGEIYNYKTLRVELEGLGYLFSTASDTEVLLVSYIEYGQDCLSRLNGMFSFVIFDPRRRSLFAARDRFGKKPFYYYLKGKRFEGASVVTQLTLPKFAVCENAVNAYFKYKYVPEPLSILRDVHKLEAGSWLEYSLGTGEVLKGRYYDLVSRIVTRPTSYQKALRDLDDLLNSAVELRMVADVPVGVFLSGGIDSSLVAAIAQSQSRVPIDTFCIGFSDPAFDESATAATIAKHIGAKHHSMECEPEDAMRLIYEHAYCYDEPFADSSSLASMLISKLARDHITVALSGDGADESFLGYNRYQTIRRASPFFKIPLALRRLMASLLSSFRNPSIQSLRTAMMEDDIGNFYHSFLQPLDQRYFSGNPGESLTNYSSVLNDRFLGEVQRAALYDVRTYLPDDINVKVDRASMYSSLEVRAPFLDYRVVEFGLSLPEKYRISDGKGKYILRELSKKYLPEGISKLPKSGFSLPIGKWFKGELKDLVVKYLEPGSLSRLPEVNPEIVNQIISDHMAGVRNRQSEIFKLLVYVLWFDHWSRGLNRDS